MSKIITILAAFAVLSMTALAPAHAIIIINGGGENGGSTNGGSGNGILSGGSGLVIDSIELPISIR